MKKTTKLLALSMCAVLALSLLAFGFAKWSTEIELGGTVSASGNWDVKVTEASVELSNAGSALEQIPVYETMDVAMYDIELHYIPSTGYYVTAIVKSSERTVAMDKVQYADYAALKTASFVKFEDGTYTKSSSMNYGHFMHKLTGNTEQVPGKKATDDGASDGVIYAEGFIWSKGTLTDEAGLTGQNNVFVTVNKDEQYFDAVISEDGTEVQYGDVNFSLPTAWANYKATITNNGTVEANLEDYSFDFTALDPEVYTVDTPDLTGCKLAPGESCHINFVVKVNDTDEALDAAAQSFKVTLNYAQEAVDEAPAAGHTH